MLSQGNIPLTDFTGKTGTNFIPFTSDEIKIEENVKIEENIQNALHPKGRFIQVKNL